ncbi:MAG: hypothetical protein IV100_24635, partial [Myxococcales bacterium]|nr:hypothetical protein [Myxococcales bacterium]
AISSWNPGEPEYIHFENPTGNSYNIFFAVTGTTQSTEGGFKVDVVRKAAPAPHCAASLPGAPQSAWPATVTKVGVMNGVGSSSGNLSAGACSNLDFASDSGVACFPATQNAAFQGNLVHYALAEPLPPNSTASIEVIPAAGVDVSLFGYTTATTSFFVPPYVPSVSVCEASYATGAANPGQSEWITFNNPTGNSYNVFFSVAGPAGVTAGAFTVKVKVETAEPQCPASLPGSSGLTAWPTGVTKLTLMGTTATGSANLSAGACTSLDFAWDSSNACFPATQSDLFEGNHLFYALSAPVPASKTVTIEITPGPQADLALYGYRTSSTSYYVPPYVPSTVDCEYSAATGKGVKETIVFPASGGTNPYNVFFGVAGASGVTGGNVTVNVTVQ